MVIAVPATQASGSRLSHKQVPSTRRRATIGSDLRPRRTFNLSGGVETVTDGGTGGNTFNLPAAGNGSAIFNAAALTDGDVFGLKAALAATQWTGPPNTLSSFLHTVQRR